MNNNESVIKEKVLNIKKIRNERNKPFVIEFTGSPEAGKTTCIDHMLKIFNEEGLNTIKIRESRKECHIPKKTVEFNDWMFKETYKNVLKSINNKNLDIILCDRGVWDNLAWYYIYSDMGLITENHFKNLYRDKQLKGFVDMMYVLKVSPEVSIIRRGENEGKVVNKEFLSKYNKFLDISVKDFLESISFVEQINTDGFQNIQEFKNYIANKILSDIYNIHCKEKHHNILNFPDIILDNISIKNSKTINDVQR